MKKHQLDAIKLFRESKSGILLCDGMGLGKTRVAAQLMADHPGAVVFWKPSMRSQFKTECREHWDRIDADPQTHWLTVNNSPYECLRGLADRHSQSIAEFLENRLIVVDEAHNLARNICRSVTSKDEDKSVVRLHQAFVRAPARFLLITATPTDGHARLLGVYHSILVGDVNHRPRDIVDDDERLNALAAVTHHHDQDESLPTVDELRFKMVTSYPEAVMSSLTPGINLVHCTASLVPRLEEAFIDRGMMPLPTHDRQKPPLEPVPRFTILKSGTTDFHQRRQEHALFYVNSPENKWGEICRVVVITHALSEGLDLRNVRMVHVLGVDHSMHTAQCAVGRARRLHSHDDLPSGHRTISATLYHTDERQLTKALLKDAKEKAAFDRLRSRLA